MELIGYELGEILIRQIISLVVIFFIGVILMHIATKNLDFKKSSFDKAAGVLITGNIVALIILILFDISILFLPIIQL